MAQYTPLPHTDPVHAGKPLPSARKTAPSSHPRTQFDTYMARAKKNGVLDKDALTTLARDAYAHQYEIIVLLSRFPDCSRAAVSSFRDLRAKKHSLGALSSGCCDQSLAARDSLSALNRAVGKNAVKDELCARDHVELTLESLEALVSDFDEHSDRPLARRKSSSRALSQTYLYINFRNHEFQQHVALFESALNTVQEFAETLRAALSPAEWEVALSEISREDISAFSARLCDEAQLSFKAIARRALFTLENNALTLRDALAILTQFNVHRAARQKELSKIVECNLLLAARETFKRFPTDDRLFDMCQEANEGLMTAADRYAYWMGYAFSTYAMWWIAQRLERFRERNTAGVFSVPCSVSNRTRSISKSLDHDGDGAAPIKKLSEELGCPTQKIDEALLAYRAPMSLEQDQVTDLFTEGFNGEQAVMRQNMIDVVHRALATLPKNKMRVCKLLWGIGQEKQTLREVAFLTQLTTERVRHIGLEGIELLRDGDFGSDLYDLYVSE